jgi:hypothetical protein
MIGKSDNGIRRGLNRLDFFHIDEQYGIIEAGYFNHH